MKDDDEPNLIVDSWLAGPEHAIQRVPVLLRVPVLRRMLQKIEKATAPKRPYRRKRVSVRDAATTGKTEVG